LTLTWPMAILLSVVVLTVGEVVVAAIRHRR
jgi:hypothetical protein